jgi:hypothetical protein
MVFNHFCIQKPIDAPPISSPTTAVFAFPPNHNVQILQQMMMDDVTKQSTFLCDLLFILLLLQLASVGLELQIFHLRSLLKCHFLEQALLAWLLPNFYNLPNMA